MRHPALLLRKIRGGIFPIRQQGNGKHLVIRTNLLAYGSCAALAAALTLFAPPAQAETDACTLLTEAKVSAAVGFGVAKGTHVTPTFVKTCTWTASSGSGVQTVTLILQPGAFFDSAKRQASMMTAAVGAGMKSAGVGDDSYFLIQGTQVALWVKKGGSAFKVSIYKQIPVDQKEGMELALAKEVVAKV